MTTTPPPPSSATNVRRQAFLRQASTPVIDSKKPALIYRWLYAQENGKGWNTFGLRDNGGLEAAWEGFQRTRKDSEEDSDVSDTNRHSAKTAGGPSATLGEKSQEQKEKGKGKGREKERQEETLMELPDPDTPLPVWRVPVAEDRLYEVDLRTQRLWPVFWKGKGCEVLRGSWFFDSSKISPCNNEVAKELEDLYHSIQPWLPSYADELKSAVTLGAEAEQKLRAPMKSLKSSYVIFLGPYLARLYSDDVTSRMTKTLWTAWSGAHGGGTLVARGFDNARRLLRTRENKSHISKSGRKSGHGSKGSTEFRESSPSPSKRTAVLGTDSPTIDGAAKPTTTKGDGGEEEDAVLAASTSSDAGTAEMLRSLATKFGSWGASSSKRASRMSLKTQNDIKDAFKEAQDRTQGLEKGVKARHSLDGGGLQEETEGGSEREEQDLTAEEEAREEEEELKREKEKEEEPIDLVLVYHGIGQKLAEAEEWKASLDFTLAVSSLRVLAHKRQGTAAPSDVGGGGMAELGKGRRVQFLPVLWRATLHDFEPPRPDEQVNPDEHLTNHFSIDDIFSDTIPIIKQLISGILFDIPLYLSQHREEIISRVVKESNRVWRLFSQRNKDFVANGGRTSLIAHSLGAALAVDILSKQPTHARPFTELAHPGAELAFDIRNLYLAGSPVALFMWINKAQLIARKGREMTMDSPVDEALDRPGRWGCLAVDRIFNIFSATDPIGTRLNSTVDAGYAKALTSIPLHRATKSVLRTLPGTLEAQTPSAGLFGGWGRSSAAAQGKGSDTREGEAEAATGEDVPDDAESLFGEEGVGEEKKSTPRGKGFFDDKRKSLQAEKLKKQAEDSKRAEEAAKQGKVERDRAERRMQALCEFGSVDFVIPLQTSILTNQYLEFLWSHAGYWTDTSFADFLLATLYASSDRLKDARKLVAKEV